MESLMPDYSENIIVGVINKETYNWYLTDKEIWFMDYKKRINAFKEKGLEVKIEYIDDSRKGLLILDHANANIFLERIEENKISTEKLRKLLIQIRNSTDDSWVYDFRPSLFVNFDIKKLYSMYSEPASYEDYVPLNWEGKYYDFFEFVPTNERYWIDKDYRNLLEKEEL